MITYDFNSKKHLANRNLACGKDNDMFCNKYWASFILPAL